MGELQWIVSMAYYKAEIKLDEVIEELATRGLLKLSDVGCVEYNVESCSIKEVEGLSDSLLSPWQVTPPHLTLSKTKLVADTAVVLAPPVELWGAFTKLKKLHTKRSLFRPPFPHITLLPTFVSRLLIDRAKQTLQEALSTVQPFKLNLKDFGVIAGGAGACLQPHSKPSGALAKLQQTIQSLVPQSKYTFEPHFAIQRLGVQCNEESQNSIASSMKRNGRLSKSRSSMF